MALKETNEVNEVNDKIIDLLATLTGRTVSELEADYAEFKKEEEELQEPSVDEKPWENGEAIKCWSEHLAAVAAANPYAEDVQEEQVNVIDLAELTLVDKLEEILNNTFNAVLEGNLLVESGQELEDMAAAVTMYERLRG